MNIRLEMYNVGAFKLLWEEDSFTPQGKPTVVTRESYSGNLLDTANIAVSKFKNPDSADFLERVNEVYELVDKMKSSKRTSPSARISHYSGISWVGEVLQISDKTGKSSWKQVAWSTERGMKLWFLYTLLPIKTEVPLAEFYKELDKAVILFERMVW